MRGPWQQGVQQLRHMQVQLKGVSMAPLSCCMLAWTPCPLRPASQPAPVRSLPSPADTQQLMVQGQQLEELEL